MGELEVREGYRMRTRMVRVGGSGVCLYILVTVNLFEIGSRWIP